MTITPIFGGAVDSAAPEGTVQLGLSASAAALAVARKEPTAATAQMIDTESDAAGGGCCGGGCCG
jgi:hypothetical protein